MQKVLYEDSLISNFVELSGVLWGFVDWSSAVGRGVRGAFLE